MEVNESVRIEREKIIKARQEHMEESMLISAQTAMLILFAKNSKKRSKKRKRQKKLKLNSLILNNI